MPSSKLSSVKNEVAKGEQSRQQRTLTDVHPIYSPMNSEPCQVTKRIKLKIKAPQPPPPPVCNHFTGVGLLAARESLSMPERLNNLASPKKRAPPPPIPPNSPIITVKRNIPPCSVRISSLAKPSTRKALQTWKDHKDHLPGDKMRNLHDVVTGGDFIALEMAERILREHLEYERFLERKAEQEKRRVFLSKRRESKRVAKLILTDITDEIVLVSSTAQQINRHLQPLIHSRNDFHGRLSHKIAQDVVKFFQNSNIIQ